MTWSYTTGVLTSTGATEASPDSLLAGIAIVQAADPTRGYRDGFAGWLNNVSIRYANSWVKVDDDAQIELRGTSYFSASGGPVHFIGGRRATLIISTGTGVPGVGTGVTNLGFLTGSTFITQRLRPQDPAFRIVYKNTARHDFPAVTNNGQILDRADIDGIDLYCEQLTTFNFLRLFFGTATTANVRQVRVFDSSSGIISGFPAGLNVFLLNGTYSNLYREKIDFGSEIGIINTVVLPSPTFYSSTQIPLTGFIREATFDVRNPTFLNNCWSGACSFQFGHTRINSQLLLNYSYTNTFLSGLDAVEGVNVRFTRARQSVTGAPAWIAPNDVVTAASNAQGAYDPVYLLDAYRAGESITDIERFNWTLKARTHNKRTADETVFANRVLYRGGVDMSAGYSEEVQMLDLSYAPATLAAGLAITGVSFDSAGNCTLTENRTALEIFQAWCSASANDLDMPDVWRYDGVTLNMGAANLSGTGTATGNFTTTGTITAPVDGVKIDSNNAGSISVTGVGVSDTAEMRRASDNSLIASRTGPGAFSVSPANVGVSVYFVRLVGGNIVMSTITTPVTLTAGVNPDVPLFAGAEVQVAQAARIDLLPTLTDIEASSVLARKPDLQIINTGVKKASLSIPHTGNLP